MADQNNHIPAFREALEQMDKARCVRLSLSMLDQKSFDVAGLYTQVLAPALNSMTESEDRQPAAIWREHVRSAIIRTIIECAYPYVLAESEARADRQDKGKVVIVSPSDEFHELGARMGSDFFLLCGYKTIFVGSNTPKADMLKGLELEQPDYVVINVVNYYNLFKVQGIVAEIRQLWPQLRILASGYAFNHDPELVHRIGALSVIRTIEDIYALEVKPS